MANEDDAAVSVSIEGDLAPLNESFDQATQSAAAAGAAINDALGSTTTGPDKLTESAQAAAAALSAIPQAAQAAASGTQSLGTSENTTAQQTDTATAALNGLAAQLTAISSQLTGMGQSLQQMASQEQEIADSSAKAASGIEKVNAAIETAKAVAEAFAAVALAETLREIASAAIEEYGEAQRVETSLTLIGGSAEAAAQQMETLRQMGMDLAVPMDTLEASARKLSAVFGVGDGLTGVLKAAANASAATGASFDTVAASLERIQLTGAVSARQLVALGISWQDLATTMGKSVDEAMEALKKGGQDAAADVQVVLDTINSKFGQAAAAQAQGILGQLQSLKDQVRDVMESIGAAIAPALGDIVTLLRNTIVPAVQAATDAFGKLPAPVRDFTVLLGGLVIAVVPVTAGLATLGFAISGVQTLLATIGIEFGAAAVGAETMGVADAAAAVGVRTLAAAQTALATANSTVAATSTALATSMTGITGVMFPAIGTTATLTTAMQALSGAADTGAATAGRWAVARAAMAQAEAEAAAATAAAATSTTAFVGSAEAAGEAAMASGLSFGGWAAVLAGPVIASIFATKGQLDDLNRSYDNLFAEIRSKSIADAINSGISINDVAKKFVASMDEIKAAVANTGAISYNVWNTVAASQQAPIDALKQMGVKMDDMFNKFAQIKANGVSAFTAIQNGASLAQLEIAGFDMQRLITAFNTLHTSGEAALTGLINQFTLLKDGWSAGANDLISKQQTLNDNVKATKSVLDEVTAAYERTGKGADLVRAAQQNYVAALDAANKSMGDHVASLGEIQLKSGLAAASYQQAVTVLRQAQAAYDAGTGSINALIAAKAQEEKAWTALHPKIATGIDDYTSLQHKVGDVNAAFDAAKSVFQRAFDALANGTGTLQGAELAQKQLETAAKNAGKALNDEALTTDFATIAAGQLRQAAQAQIGTLITAVKTYQQLRDSGNTSADAQLALAKQMDVVTAMAKQAGAEVTKTGNILQFSVPDAVAKANPALIDLILKMNGISLAGVDVVNVNGKLVITMKDVADAAKAGAQDMGGWAKTTQQVFDASGKLNGQVTVLKGSMDQQAASADKLTSANQRLTSASKSLGDVMVVTGGNLLGVRDHMESLNGLLNDLSHTTLVATQNENGFGVSVQNTADIMKNASADVDSYTNAVNQAAAAVNNAARMESEWDLQTKANKLTGSFGAQDVLGIYQAAGASTSELDSIAQALGLVKLGNGNYETQDVFQAQQAATAASRQAYIQQKEANPSSITKYDRADFPELADAYAKWAAGLNQPSSSTGTTSSTSSTSVVTSTSSTSSTTTNNAVTPDQAAAIAKIIAQSLNPLPQTATTTLGGSQTVTLAPLDQATIDAITMILGLPSSSVVSDSTDAAQALTTSLSNTTDQATSTNNALDTLSSSLTSTATATNAAFAKISTSVDAVTAGLDTIATATQATAQQFAQFSTTGLTQFASGLGSLNTALVQASNHLDASGNPIPTPPSSNPGVSRVPLSSLNITLGTPQVSPIVLQPNPGQVSLPGPASAVPPASSTAAGVTVNVTVQAGTVVGQNGMQQLSDMVGKNVVNLLKQNTGLRLY